MEKCFNQKQAHANINSAMEPETIQKNGAIIKIMCLFICLIAGLILVSCEKPTENKDDTIIGDHSMADDPLSAEFLEFLESLPVIHITVDDFDFENSDLFKTRSSSNEMVFCQSEIDKVFFEMGKFALTQTDDFDDNDKNKLIQNKQSKLAYIWGGKKGFDALDWGTLYGSNCTDKLYGFDCSGFVYRIFKEVGINISTGNAHKQFNDIKNLKHAGRYYNSEIVVIELSDDEITMNNLRNGDVIFRINENDSAKHIGIVLKTIPYGVALFQSRGDKNTCTNNKNSNYGPVLTQLPTLDGFNRGGKPRVLRIRPKIFEIVPNEMRFDYNGGNKAFYIKTNFPIEDVKALDNSICSMVRPFGVTQTCGDTTIYTYNVIVEENLSSNARSTEIVVSVKVNDKIEEKKIDIFQEENTNIGVFQLDFVINEMRESIYRDWESTYKHCNTELILYNINEGYGGRAILSSFFINEMDWGWSSTGWPAYDPVFLISWSNGTSAPYIQYTYWDDFAFVWLNIIFSVDITKAAIGEEITGVFTMGEMSFYNDRVDRYRGSASITKIQ